MAQQGRRGPVPRDQRETSQGEGEEVESQGRISVHKRMRKNTSQWLGPRAEESGENSRGPSNEDARDILKLRKEMEELKRQIDKDGSFGPTVEIISPFTARAMKAQLPRGMKAPEIRYKGFTDPNDHLAAYQTHMLMHAVEDEIQCRLFVGTLEGPAVKWFLTLPNGTIDCFKDLAQLFLNAYGGRFQPKKHFTHLFSLKQKEGETNTELVQRWNEAINEVEPMDDKTSIALFMSVLRSGELFRRLDYDTPTSYKAMMARVNKFCATEESDRIKGKNEGALHKGSDKEKKGEKAKATTLSIPTLKPLAAPVAEIKRSIKLDVIIGEHPKVRHMRMDFVVVDIKCAHNPILGRPGLEDLGGALSLEHLCLKFRTPEGVGRALGDQPAAKKAYLNACKRIGKENLNIQTIGQALEDKERKEEDRERPKPAVEMEEVMLFPEGDPEKVVRIGLGLEEDIREEIIRCVLAVVVTVKRLTPYFQAHPVRIMTDQPLGAVLRDPSSSGRVIKWAMVLSQYDISYQPRSSKKGQVIADFMVECTARGKPEEDGTGQERKMEIWEIHSDGSCTKDGSGGGAVLTSPEGFKAYHSFKFTFRTTNNEAEYEALIGGIKIALFMKIKHIRFKSDSKLAIGQLKGEMEAKEGRLKRYRDYARTLLGKFEYYELIYVSREENEEAGMLPKLCKTVPVHMESMVRQHEKTCPVWEEAVPVLEISGLGTTWMSPLSTYLEKGELPVDPKEARRVQLMAPKYQLDGGKLYKKDLRWTDAQMFE
ncbi:unnamed protein product [Cuscuta campestris]|uniref:Uncharacterized protein n=1 Tax=Cuscuta campestris TaxID=132261 RepID=A0A484M536_9ASTE|nr:unnamed protein product [Cuscuta campestris]